MPTRRPTESDRREAIRSLLEELRRGTELPELALSLESLHPRGNTFPGEVFMEVAVQAMNRAGIEQRGLRHEELLTNYLPDYEFQGRRAQKIRFAILATGAARGGIDPDLLDEASGGEPMISGSMPSPLLSPSSEPARPSRGSRLPISLRTWRSSTTST